MAQVGIAYIKIAKIDGNGVDQTFTLESLTNIVIPYSDVGNQNYKIQSRTEKPNYFLYQTQFNNTLSSTSASVDYDSTGSISGNFKSDFPIKPTQEYYPPITPLTDPFNFFNSNVYNLNTYPQKDLFIYATGSLESINNGNNTAVQQVVSLIEKDRNGNEIDKDDFSISPNVGPFGTVLTASFYVSSNINRSSSIGSDFYIRIRYIGSIVAGASEITSSLGPTSFFYITSSASTGSEYTTIPEPHFSSNFSRAYDCQPLLNNAVRIRSNKFLQDLDYQTSQNIPVNYQAVVSGSATKGTVPESNYTQLTSTNIRYNGSKIQSEKINIFTEPSGSTDFNKSWNIGTYGKTPSIEVDETIIYEYEWAGGTTPEILGWGAYKVSKLLNVKTIDDVRIINPGVGLENQLIPVISPVPGQDPNTFGRDNYISQSVSEYYYTLNGNNPTNSNISIFPYETDIGESSPSFTKVLTPEFGVPTISNFILTSSNSQYGEIISGSYAFALTGSFDISRVKKENGAYTTGETAEAYIFAYSPSESLSPLINDGERWFVTFYNDLEAPIDNNLLIPYNEGFTATDSDGNLLSPLGYKGVHEIFGCRASGGKDYITTYDKFTTTMKIGGGGVGCLIWKARSPGDNEFVMVQSAVGPNGPGCFVDQYTTDEIIQNLEKITIEFGSNKQ